MSRVVVAFDKMSDRQDLIGYMEARKLGLEPYSYDRDDMFWARAFITDIGLKAEVTYCIGAALHDTQLDWSLSFQYGSDLISTDKLRAKVLIKWERSPERIQAAEWMWKLINAGYYDHGRLGGPNTNSGRCPHCGFSFEKGTTHPHTYLKNWNRKGEKQLIYHHKLMGKTIKELGLTKMGVSALPDIPSLEEIGELEPVTV